MSSTTNQVIEQFAAAMAAHDLHPAQIEADGKLHRFDANDDKKGKQSAWYVLHGDGIAAGAFGNWKADLSEKWCASPSQALTPQQQSQMQAHIQQAKQAALETRLRLEAEAAQACNKLMGFARDAGADNPYCVRKGIKPYGLKEFKDSRTLLIPIRDSEGKLVSIQFIAADGTKRFKTHGRIKGGYYAIGGKPDGIILVCEGFADAASLYAATGYPVAIAFSAGNLEAVACQLRAKLPDTCLVICADNDRFNPDGNIGLNQASAAAQAVAGLLAVPQFEAGEDALSDFNDLAQAHGPQAVLAAVNTAEPAGNYQPIGKGRGHQRTAPLNDLAQHPHCPQQAHSHPINTMREGRKVQIRCAAQIKPTPIHWLWEGWLPAGKLAILAGSGGTGKTTLALTLAATVTQGGKWPDGSHCKEKGNVLIWSSEDGIEDTLVPRLMAAGADLSRCFFINGTSEDGVSVPFDPAQDIFDLSQSLNDIGAVSLLIIDPIVSAVAGDMHRANDVRRSLQPLVAFAESKQCAVVGISHFAKDSGGKAPQDRLIGSQAFGALARMVLVAAKEEQGTRRVLARAKSNIAQDDGGIAYCLHQREIAPGIVASFTEWDGVVEGSAREILAGMEEDEYGDAASRKDLKQLIVDTMEEAGGSISSKLLRAEVVDADFTWDAAKRLKKSLGIEAKKQSMKGPWIWYFAAQEKQQAQMRGEEAYREATQTTQLARSTVSP